MSRSSSNKPHMQGRGLVANGDGSRQSWYIITDNVMDAGVVSHVC